jgi:hypothetical protein
MRNAEATTWVVYEISAQEKAGGRMAVCEQGEWEEMERWRPGYHTLIRQHIRDESEAEKLARGTSGDVRTVGRSKKPAPPPLG